MYQKNIHILLLFVLVLFFLGANTQSNCSYTPEIEGLQASFVTLNLQQANQNLPKSEYNKIKTQKIDYPLQIAFTKRPSIAIGIEDININSIYVEEFSLKVLNANTTTAVFQFSYKPSVWKIIKFNFWVSTRSDIILGTYVQNFNSLFNQTGNIVIKFSKPIKNAQKMISRSFINGLAVNAQRTKSVNLTLKANQCEQNQQVLEVTVGQNFDLKTIWISVFIFSPSEVPFASYGGGFQRQNWQGYSAQSIHRFIPGLKYPIFGLVQLQLRTEGALIINLSVDPDLVFENEISRTIQKYNAQYILVGQTASNSCNKCGLLNYRNECIDKCPQNSYLFEYSNGGKACLECSKKIGLQLNANKTGCICATGFTQNGNGTCIRQGNSSSTISNNQGSSNNGGNVDLNKVNTCSAPNTYWAGYKCLCKPGFYLDQGNCVKFEITSSNKIFNVPTIFYKKIQQQVYDNNNLQGVMRTDQYQTPNPIFIPTYPINQNSFERVHKNYHQTNCGVCQNAPMAPVQNPCNQNNEYFNGKECQCIDGFKKVNGICEQQNEPPTKCLPNSYVDSDGYCQCLNGFQFDRNLNKCVKMCPVNSRSIDDRCQCNIGFYFNQNAQTCEQIYCPPYSSFSTRQYKCVCDDGRTQVGDSCLRCNADLVWSQALKRCVKGCVGNQVFDIAQQRCICQNGLGLYQDQCQRCPANHALVNGYCEQCPANTYLDQKSLKCECVGGYSLNSMGSCSKICKDTFWFNSNTGSCECPRNTYLVDGKCSTCPQGTQYNAQKLTCQVNNRCPSGQIQLNGQCVCTDGKGFIFQNGNYFCVDCYQLEAGYLKDGYCFKCPGQTIFINGACNCPNGLLRNSDNKCNPKQPECNANQFFNLKTYQCECVDGYFQIAGQCSRCPTGRVYNANTKNCDVIPPKCPNNLIERNGDCICPQNLGFITNSNGFRQCVDCFSLTGGYLENGLCRRCPGQTIYTINGCNCPTGLIRDVNNTCKPKQPECGVYQFYDQQSYKCDCIDGYFWIAGQCSKCPSGRVYNPNTKTCDSVVPVCPNNQTYVNGKCICSSGRGFNSNGICIDCTTLKGGYLQNGFCKQCQGQTIRVNNICQCPEGTVINEFKKCNKRVVCPFPETYNQNRQLCECPSNLVRIDGICSTCPFGTQYITASQNCRPVCSKSQIKDVNGICKNCGNYETPVNNVCQCVQGYNRNLKTGICEIVSNKNCDPGWYWIQGKCQSCKQNSHYDVSIGKCLCNPGFLEGQYNVCKLKTQTLTCPTGQHYFNGNCVLCPRFSYYDPVLKSCTCVFGFNMDQTGNCVTGLGGSTVNVGSSGSSGSSSSSNGWSGVSTGSSSNTSNGSGLSAGSSSSASTSSSGSSANTNAGSSSSGSATSAGSSSSSSGGSSSSAGSSASGFSQSSTHQSGTSTGTSSSTSTATGTTSQSGSITNTQTSSGFQSNINGSSGTITQTRNGNVITTVITSPNGATITQHTTVNDGDFNAQTQNGSFNQQSNYQGTNIYSNINSGYGSSIESNQQTYGSNANLNTANQGSQQNTQQSTSTQTSVQSSNGGFINQNQNTQGVNILNVNNNGKVDQSSSGSIGINQQYTNVNGQTNYQNNGQVSGFGIQNNFGSSSNGNTQQSSTNQQGSSSTVSNNSNQSNHYSAPQPLICGVKTYLNQRVNKCEACPEGCVYCSSLTTCSLCDIGYMLVDSKCVPRCGDGITTRPQQCDDGNFFNGDGCTKQCTIQNGFNCSGTPSFCRNTRVITNQSNQSTQGSSSSSAASSASSASGSSSSSAASGASSSGSSGIGSSAAGSSAAAASGSGSGTSSATSAASSSSSSSSSFNQQSSSSSSSASSASSSTGVVRISNLQTADSPSLTLVKKPSSNAENVFVELRTNPVFRFKSDIDMKKFIQYDFYDRSTVPQGGLYCTQLKQDQSIFRCLLNYNSGVPTKIYSVKFFYDYNGFQASANVQIDTLNTMFSLRSLN